MVVAVQVGMDGWVVNVGGVAGVVDVDSGVVIVGVLINCFSLLLLLLSLSLLLLI